ncbi:MAG: HD domain-containing protein [Flavobacteriaceae bacterium]
MLKVTKLNIYQTNKLKIFNDPIYGFISIPKTIIFDLIEHPYFQRLRRISQMGMSYLVYPGAHHSRFHHATGCLYLMNKAVRVLRAKGVAINSEEETGLYIAILLHDIGHGPFSHALEHSIVSNVSHEEISLKFMEEFNTIFSGKLDLAISIFKGQYSRVFFHQLVSSQLDIDRLDYLKRDSFYSGVAEGSINSDRLIAMMNVKDDALVIEEKGIYSIEKFIVARRLMYWQVYLHKTGVVAENMMVNVLKRAKELSLQGEKLLCSPSLEFFLSREIGLKEFDSKVLSVFAELDDVDILSALKMWKNNPDKVLSTLSSSLLDRKLLKIEMSKEAFDPNVQEERRRFLANQWNLSEHEVGYFVFEGFVKNLAYNDIENKINLLMKDGSTMDFVKASDDVVAARISHETKKYFNVFPKELSF